MSKFHPDDLTNPLYEHSQVITTQDLQTIYCGLALQYKASKWWELRQKYNIIVSASAIHELILWLNEGKPKLQDIGDIK